MQVKPISGTATYRTGATSEARDEGQRRQQEQRERSHARETALPRSFPKIEDPKKEATPQVDEALPNQVLGSGAVVELLSHQPAPPITASKAFEKKNLPVVKPQEKVDKAA